MNHGTGKIQVRGLRFPAKSREKPEIVHGLVLEMAYHLVPRVEGLPETFG
jgi:hypothetical protein